VFRLSASALVELVLTILLGLAGLLMLASTWSKYKATRAFGKAMDGYAAGDIESVHEALEAAAEARPGYTAPQEALGKLMIDDAARLPAKEAAEKFAAARDFFERLKTEEESAEGNASQAVLIGLAVAGLEATRAHNPPKDELRRAVADARARLDEARSLYPQGAAIGDLYVDLATTALLDDNVPAAEECLQKVREVGNVSNDALRYVYNLKGLIALRKGGLEDAAAEFQIVHEFAPDWEVPRLNLAAAQAQNLLRGDLDIYVAESLAGLVQGVLERAKKDPKGQLVGPIYNTLAIHAMRNGRAELAESFLKDSEKFAPLGWHARFNRAIASYLMLRKDRIGAAQRDQAIGSVRRELEAALPSPNATLRDRFTALCVLGTLDAMAKQWPSAITRFESAAKTNAPAGERFVRSALPRVHRALAALCYKTEQFKKALDELDKSTGLTDQADVAAAMARQLRMPPVVESFDAKPAKIATDFDVRIRAQVSAPSVPKPLSPENIRLTLTNSLTGTVAPIPFRLLGSQLRAVLLDLPQGRFRVELQVTDLMGNASQVAVREFEFDREPPRILDRVPAPAAVVKRLDAIEFRVDDVVMLPDLSTLSVSLQYPKGAASAMAMLVSRGKYLVENDSTKVNAEASAEVKAPVRRPTPPGKYIVSVRVQDALGKKCETEWSFTLE